MDDLSTTLDSLSLAEYTISKNLYLTYERLMALKKSSNQPFVDSLNAIHKTRIRYPPNDESKDRGITLKRVAIRGTREKDVIAVMKQLR